MIRDDDLKAMKDRALGKLGLNNNDQLRIIEEIEQLQRESAGWRDIAAQSQRNTEYYRGLVVRIGEIIGPQAYIADDGSKMEDVLCAKVPELVDSLKCVLKDVRRWVDTALGGE